MSFSPRNVSQLIVARTPLTIANFIAGSTVGDYTLTVIPAVEPVGAVAGDQYFTNISGQYVVRTETGIKTCEVITRDMLDSYSASVLTAGVLGKSVVTIPAGVASQTTKVTIVVNDGIGSHLNERFINAYAALDAGGNFVDAAGAVVDGTTQENLVDEILAQLSATVLQQGSEFTLAKVSTTGISIEAKRPSFRVGANDGEPQPFSVLATTIGTAGNQLSKLTQVVTQPTPDGLIQAKNLEWFISGYSKDPYRIADALSSFAADNNIVANGIVADDLMGIYQYHKDREGTNVERQPRQLIVIGEAGEVDHSALNTALTAVTVKA